MMLSRPLPQQRSGQDWSFKPLELDEDDDIEILEVRPKPTFRALPPTTKKLAHENTSSHVSDIRPGGLMGQKKRPALEDVQELSGHQPKKARHEMTKENPKNRFAPGSRDDQLRNLMMEITPPTASQKSSVAIAETSSLTNTSKILPALLMHGASPQGGTSSPKIQVVALTEPADLRPINYARSQRLKSVASTSKEQYVTTLTSSHDLACTQSQLTTSAPSSRATPAGSTSRMPFILDDDEMNDETPVPAQIRNPQSTTKKASILGWSNSGYNALEKERQRLESASLREKAKERHRLSTSSSDEKIKQGDIKPDSFGIASDRPLAGHSPDGGAQTLDLETLKREESIDAKPEYSQHMPEEQTGPAVSMLVNDRNAPYSSNQHMAAGCIALPHIKASTTVDGSKGSGLQESALSKRSKTTTDVAADSMPSGSNENKEERLSAIRKENTRREEERIRAQIKADREAEKEAQNLKAKKEAERRRVEQAQQAAAAEKKAEAEKAADLENKRHALMRKAIERRREDAINREAAARARAEEQCRLETEKEQRRYEQQQKDKQQWDEAQKARQALEEGQRKRAEAARKEANAAADREGALAKLSRVVKSSEDAHGSHKTLPPGGDIDVQRLLSAKEPQPMFRATDTASPPGSIKLVAGAPRSQLDITVAHQDAQLGVNSTESSESGRAADASRQQRIDAKKERNARMRQAEELEEEDQPDVPILPIYQPLRRAPVSLNSVEGQARLARSDAEIGIHRLNNGTLTSKHADAEERRRKKHERRLGEILLEDIRLVKRADLGWRWDDISFALGKAFGCKKANATLQKRSKQVREALNAANVTTELLDLADAGNAEARLQLNRMVHGSEFPSAVNPSGCKRSRDALGHFVADESPGLCTPMHAGGWNSPASGSSFESNTLSGPPFHSPTRHDSGDGDRPHTSGKTMNEETWKYYWGGARDQYQEEPEEPVSIRELSPVTEDDYCHFEYQAVCRQLSQDELDDDVDIDGVGWIACSEVFDNLDDANTAAANCVFSVPEGMHTAVKLSKGHNLNSHPVEDGMYFHELKGVAGGVRQVKVNRFLRTHQDGVLPTNKDGWVPKTVYFVKERETTKSGDDMFEEQKESVVEQNVDNKVYTTLELANTCAAHRFIRQAYVPESGHLTRRELEYQEAEKQVLAEFDQDEGEMFKKGAETEDGRTVVEVWVEEGQVVGPRNL